MTLSTISDKPLLYSMAACPYAQRTKILLDFKNIAYEEVEIDLAKPRPQALLDVNPLGKVPALIHKGKALNESSIINEYLEDTFPDTPLFPADPYQKAMCRLLINYCNIRFSVNHYRLLMEQNPTKRGKAEDAVRKDWLWLDAFLHRTNPDGDYAFQQFGMADLTYAPFFARCVLNEYFWGYQFVEEDALERVQRWRSALKAHPVVQTTSLSEEHYIKLYADYALGYSNGALPLGHSQSLSDLTITLNARPMPAKRV